ncbi:hypothetical protein [Thalassobacillus sp. CUG 92003]|uniref:hypothetical protein n=1 Tax=Thalassobacillus sp. CUG 92003 TaxID=2736641 RepID=UPI0015E695FA|nr:hypothetical protein [Thalassobacillus sp. CUG 92003]
MKINLFKGILVGILAGGGALMVEYMAGWSTGLWFEELSIVSILVSSIIANLAGVLIFHMMEQKTYRATLYYVMLVTGVTILLTLNTIANPPQEQFGIVGHPIHIVVALISIWLIPKWTKNRTSTLQDNPTAKAN